MPEGEGDIEQDVEEMEDVENMDPSKASPRKSKSRKSIRKSVSNEVEADDSIKKLNALTRYYTEALRFTHQVSLTLGPVNAILASNKKGDVLECINFYTTLYMV